MRLNEEDDIYLVITSCKQINTKSIFLAFDGRNGKKIAVFLYDLSCCNQLDAHRIGCDKVLSPFHNS